MTRSNVQIVPFEPAADTRSQAVATVQELLEKGLVTPEDLRRMAYEPLRVPQGRAIEEDWMSWFEKLGLRGPGDQRLQVSKCPFSLSEQKWLIDQGFLILCLPKTLNVHDLAAALHLQSWADSDALVSVDDPQEDDWFATPATLEPPYQDLSLRRSKQELAKNSYYGLSLRRYLLFLGRFHYLGGEYPDRRWWTWLPKTRYDQSGYLIAGLDLNDKLSVHGWMSNFSAKFTGTRYCILPKRPIGTSLDYRD